MIANEVFFHVVRITGILLSRFLFLLLYYIIRYRRRVVRINLQKAFSSPHLTDIEKKFYLNLSEMPFEILLALIMPAKNLNKLVRFNNFQVILESAKKSNCFVFGLIGHFMNWELIGIALPFLIKDVAIPASLYRKQSIIFVNRIIELIRERTGALLIPEQHLYRNLLKLKENKGKKYFVCVVGDQTPLLTQKHIWTDFLGIETPFYSWWVKIVKREDAPVFYGSIKKEKFARYSVNIEIISEEPASETEESLLKKYVNFLERDIKKTPELWLWSHRRWKRIPDFYKT